MQKVEGSSPFYILRDEFDTGTRGQRERSPRRALRDPAGDPGSHVQSGWTVPAIRPATFRARPGSASTSATSCSSTARSGRISNVEPRLYRLRFLNGCNARILTLRLPGARMWQIGAEGGLWDRPVRGQPAGAGTGRTRRRAWSTSAPWPARRSWSATIVHRPPVATPAPPLAPGNADPGRRSSAFANPSYPSCCIGGRAARLPAPPRQHRRFITLNEVRRRHRRLGADAQRGRLRRRPPTETPARRHRRGLVLHQPHRRHAPHACPPLHVPGRGEGAVRRRPLHRRSRPARGRRSRWHQPLAVRDRTAHASRPNRARIQGHRQGESRHLHDHPGRFDLPHGVSAPQTYVHHCHILEHEDNDMMRPFTVVP